MSTDSQQRMSIYLLIVLRMFIHSLILLFKIKKKKKKKTKPKFELGGFLWRARVIGLWLVFA